MSRFKLARALLDDDEAEITRMCQDHQVREDINNRVVDKHLGATLWKLFTLHGDTFTCFRIACFKSKIHIVQLLVSAGAEIRHESKWEHTTAFHYSCISKVDVIEKVKYLLQLDQTLLHNGNWCGETALHVATEHADIDVMKYLS